MGTEHYRVRLRLHSPIATPLHSGTLFGHLCWAWRGVESEASLESWLEGLRGEPMLLSDAFPMDYLPRPMLAPSLRATALSLGEIDQSKPLRKRAWISKAAFLKIRGNLSEGELMASLFSEGEPKAMTRKRQAHNRIDRLRGGTVETGGLYFTEEDWVDDASCYLDVYVQTSLPAKRLAALFQATGEWGYGKDATVGRGRWDAEVERETSGLFAGDGGRLMSLSHGTLTPNMADARYRLHVHYGKTGNVYANSSSPYKYPMTLLRPGATFRRGGEGAFGELLSDVHPEKPWIVNNGWHLPVPFTEVL